MPPSFDGDGSGAGSAARRPSSPPSIPVAERAEPAGAAGVAAVATGGWCSGSTRSRIGTPAPEHSDVHPVGGAVDGAAAGLKQTLIAPVWLFGRTSTASICGQQRGQRSEVSAALAMHRAC